MSEEKSGADEILDGERCQECGCWLKKAVGYPITCRDCGGNEEPLI